MVGLARLALATAAMLGSASAADPQCSHGGVAQDAVLLQRHRLTTTAANASTPEDALTPEDEDATPEFEEAAPELTAAGRGGCVRRTWAFWGASSACVVVRDRRALLVWVPYGRSPGWDLPGGRKDKGERACETAEREVCEETGIKVKAVRALSWNVFKCEVVAWNVCRKAKDEGFLRTKWVSLSELDDLRYRGKTWGNKKGFLKRVLRSARSLLQAEEPRTEVLDN